MGKLRFNSESAPREMQADQLGARVSWIQRRQWWLWSASILITLLLAVGVASFAFPGLLSEAEPFSSFYLSQAVRGLVGLVLLFNVYVIYQQVQIHRIQRQMTQQIATLGSIETRTAEVYRLAALDPLTGLHNRLSGDQRLKEEIARRHRHGYPLAVLALDLNELKYVNDKFGHAAGDELIKIFSHRLKRAIRGSDVAVRPGGDEFFVVLPECRPDDVQCVINRMHGIKIDIDGQSIPVTFAAGWAEHMTGEDAEELLKRADDALYVNKRTWKEQRKASTLASA
jgi:diguanylate cyclase (GGDEF)-like protein